MFKENNSKNEKGDIVVEAILSLSVFLFAIFTLLSFVKIFYIQGRMSIALNSAAKEISQYSYIYYKFGLNELDQKLSEDTEGSRELATDTIDCMSGFMNAISTAKSSYDTKNMDNMIGAIEGGSENVKELYKMYAEPLSEDPMGLIMGMGKLAVSDLKEEGKAVLARVLATSFMKKNLKASEDTDPDHFLRSYGVIEGLDGLDFQYTVLMPQGKSSLVQLVVTYDVQLVQLLEIDFKFKIRQCAKTSAWGNGVSVISPEESTSTKLSIWDEGGGTRGKVIVDKEKKNFEYTSTGKGFDGYDSKKNQFITVTSADTTTDSYSTADGIRKNKLNAAYRDLKNKIPKLEDNIEMTNKSGNKVSVNSDPSTRNYKIVLVVPDNADMSIVNTAVKDFKDLNPGVDVEVKTGYGSPKPPASKTDKDEDNKDSSENK